MSVISRLTVAPLSSFAFARATARRRVASRLRVAAGTPIVTRLLVPAATLNDAAGAPAAGRALRRPRRVADKRMVPLQRVPATPLHVSRSFVVRAVTTVLWWPIE